MKPEIWKHLQRKNAGITGHPIHRAPVAVSQAVTHRSGGTCRFDKYVSGELCSVKKRNTADILSRGAVFIFCVYRPCRRSNVDAHLFQQTADGGFHLDDVIQAGMTVSRKIDISFT